MEEGAAQKIQRAWRGYTNRKIYKYYRDIIYFKCKGNPAKLLKGINPAQAKLLQNSTSAYVRFRLGGQNFPPNIYYKIFSLSKVIDINAFAPRDYSSLPRTDGPQKMTLEQYNARRNIYEGEGWYLRTDNNGWRPISHKMFVKLDQVEYQSAGKHRYYHHQKQKRVEKFEKKRRINKLRWLQHMFEKAREEEKMDEEDPEYMQIHPDFNPLKDPKLIEMQNEQFQEQVKELIEWSQDLDYDAYLKNWFQLSISRPSGISYQTEKEAFKKPFLTTDQ